MYLIEDPLNIKEEVKNTSIEGWEDINKGFKKHGYKLDLNEISTLDQLLDRGIDDNFFDPAIKGAFTENGDLIGIVEEVPPGRIQYLDIGTPHDPVSISTNPTGALGISGQSLSLSDEYGADIKFPTATHGVLLKDRTAGTYYRLFVNSGTLSIESA